MDEADVAELRIDVADACDRRAVVQLAAHQQHIAGAELQPLGGGQARVHQRPVGRAREALEGDSPGCKSRITATDLADDVAGIAQHADGVARGERGLWCQQPLRVPFRQPIAQPQAEIEQILDRGMRDVGDIVDAQRAEIGVVDRAVEVFEIADQGCRGRRRTVEHAVPIGQRIFKMRRDGRLHAFSPCLRAVER